MVCLCMDYTLNFLYVKGLTRFILRKWFWLNLTCKSRPETGFDLLNYTILKPPSNNPNLDVVGDFEFFAAGLTGEELDFEVAGFWEVDF